MSKRAGKVGRFRYVDSDNTLYMSCRRLYRIIVGLSAADTGQLSRAERDIARGYEPAKQ